MPCLASRGFGKQIQKILWIGVVAAAFNSQRLHQILALSIQGRIILPSKILEAISFGSPFVQSSAKRRRFIEKWEAVSSPKTWRKRQRVG